MCGRFALYHSPVQVMQYFGIVHAVPFAVRYNIAPSQLIAMIYRQDTVRHMALMRWGLIPSWAKDARIGNRLINARVETVAEKPAFRQSFRSRRCIIPVSGFYEWQDRTRVPYYFHAKNEEEPLAIAGIWDTWQEGNHYIRSVALLTTEADDMVRPVHSRMPLLLCRDDLPIWLAQDTDEEQLRSLLGGGIGSKLVAQPVSHAVNHPTHDSPDCIQRVRDET